MFNRLCCNLDSPESSLRCYEGIFLPDDLALGNRLLRDESFPLIPVEIFIFDGFVRLETSGPLTSMDDG